MPMPQSPEELQALFESLIAAGKVPQEILDRMKAGEKFVLRATQQGLVLQPEAPPNQGSATPGEGAPPAVAQAPSAPPPPSAPPSPAQRLAPARPLARQPLGAPLGGSGGAPKPLGQPPQGRPANVPKPGRNDACPCGSGIKYKKCCAPAFD
jgi:hypothetical protein